MPRGSGIGYVTGAHGKTGGHGRMGGNRAGSGPSGHCVCSSCGERVIHERSVPCYSMKCPKCGTRMTRE